MNDSNGKRVLLVVLFALLAAIVFGLLWFFFFGPTAENMPVGVGWYLFSFAAGLSMIVLPCTLPLAFVIVPLSMGKGPLKGFLIACAFGLGVTLTLSMYGVLAAVLGKVAIGSLGAPLEVVKNWLYLIAGVFAYLFALGELGLVRAKMPTYTGAFPDFIQKQQDVLKALLLGLFLGNLGVGCPHPATPVILTRIAVSGDVFYGWLLFLVHAIGRVLPLIFLAILGIIGVNALQTLVSKKDKIERATGWGMVFVAAFILCLGLFTHDWWVLSGQHTYLESITQEERFLGAVSDRIGAAAPHVHGMPPESARGLFGLPLWLGSWVLVALWIIPMWWNYARKKKELASVPEAERETKKALLNSLLWNITTLSLLLIVVFAYFLPNKFKQDASADHGGMHHETLPGMETADHGHEAGTPEEHEHMDGMVMPGDEHAGHSAMMHESEDIKNGFTVSLSADPATPSTGELTGLDFFVHNEPSDIGISESELELEHTKKMHVIGVRSDLNEFFHVHPLPYAGASSSNFFVNYQFKKPGDYKIWSEVKQFGINHIIGQPMLKVAGDGPTSEVNKAIVTSKVVQGYQVRVHYEGLYANRENPVEFIIRDQNGGEVALDDYIGAKMHLAVVSEDLKTFIHVHPSGGESAGHEHSRSNITETAYADELAGSYQSFSVNFPAPGYYKLFGQFKPSDLTNKENLPDDYYLLADFWVKVDAAPPSILSNWWVKLLISLVLMAGLSWAVKKFIDAPLTQKL